jgi:hypothetical protein
MSDDMGFDLKVGEMTFPQWQEWLVRYNVFIVERDARIDELGAANDKLSCDALQLYARIEKLEAVTKDDAKWLATYHKWCEMNGCAPSSSDLIAARKALEGKDD